MDYENRWMLMLSDACGGNHFYLDDMPPTERRQVVRQVFRQYLVECYIEHVRDQLGPALAPEDASEVLRLKATLTHHWTPAEVRSMDQDALISALVGHLSSFKLPGEAYRVVAHLEFAFLQSTSGNSCISDMLPEMVKHHRPDHLAGQ